jgi:hypothetical protein
MASFRDRSNPRKLIAHVNLQPLRPNSSALPRHTQQGLFRTDLAATEFSDRVVFTAARPHGKASRLVLEPLTRFQSTLGAKVCVCDATLSRQLNERQY